MATRNVVEEPMQSRDSASVGGARVRGNAPRSVVEEPIQRPSSSSTSSAPPSDTGFAQGVKRGVLNIGRFAHQFGSDLANPAMPVLLSDKPEDQGSTASRLQGESMLGKYVLQPAAAMKQKAVTAPTSAESLGYSAAEAIPFFGPIAANLGERIGAGDTAGATGEGLTYALSPRVLRGVGGKALDVARDVPGLRKVIPPAPVTAPPVRPVTAEPPDAALSQGLALWRAGEGTRLKSGLARAEANQPLPSEGSALKSGLARADANQPIIARPTVALAVRPVTPTTQAEAPAIARPSQTTMPPVSAERAVGRAIDNALGVQPLKPNVSLREQFKSEAEPKLSLSSRPDKAVLQKAGADEATIDKLLKVDNVDLRQLAINLGEDMGQQGIGRAKQSGSIPREAIFGRLLKRYSPEEIARAVDQGQHLQPAESDVDFELRGPRSAEAPARPRGIHSKLPTFEEEQRFRKSMVERDTAKKNLERGASR